MGYPSPLGGITKRINQYTVTHSVKFSRFNKFGFGNRCAIINIPNTNKLILWSSIPVSRELEQTIEAATDNEPNKFEIFAVIIPDTEHTLAAIDVKKLYPKALLIGPSGIKDKPDLKLDYEFKDEQANKVISGSTISEELSNYDFVFINQHANRELVTYDKTTKTLFEADLLFNIPSSGKTEQYPAGDQNKGFGGFLNQSLNPNSKVGRFLMRRLVSSSKEGLKSIYDLDFETIIVSHGENITQDAKETFKKVFGPNFAKS